MADQSDDDNIADPPAGSRAVVEDAIDGVTIKLPPMGVWRATRWMFPFGLIWCAIIAMFTAMFVPGLRSAGWGIICAACVVLPIFWAFGLAFLLGSINMGRRRAVLAVVGDRLLIVLTGPFGRERREWARADLRRIEVGASDMEVNNKPVLELHIRPAAGKTYALLAGRDEAELRWVAARLRAAIKM